MVSPEVPIPFVTDREKVDDEEVSSIYLEDGDRYVVSYIVSYADADVSGPRDAAHWALMLTQDAGSDKTVWRVYDRHTKETFEFQQREFD